MRARRHAVLRHDIDDDFPAGLARFTSHLLKGEA
jgi:hypothetical protein